MKLIEEIERVSHWENIKHVNPHLDFATMCLMAESVGFDVEPLGDFWRKEYRNRCEVSPGLFKRVPEGYYGRKMSFSHDEMLGLAWCSWRFDRGLTAKRVLDQGRFLGLYLSGYSGKWLIDSEWFVLMRPEYRGFVKLGANRNITHDEQAGIEVNLMLTTSWNLLDFRILWLEQLGVSSLYTDSARARMAHKYRERYGDNPIYQLLWKLRDKKGI